MPISADPSRRADFSLKIDADKPQESRPTFECRFLTSRQRAEQRRLCKAAATEKDDVEANKLLNQAIGIGVVGWRNFDNPFSIEAIGDALTDLERWELAWDYPSAVELAEFDLKKSPSQPGSVPGPSAVPVPADATTSPQS
jgi:hypothetical protein